MKRPDMAYARWGIRRLLALIFLFAGGTKPVLPPETMTEQMPLPLPALLPPLVVVGLLSASVTYGRRRPTLHRGPASVHEAGYGHRPLYRLDPCPAETSAGRASVA